MTIENINVYNQVKRKRNWFNLDKIRDRQAKVHLTEEIFAHASTRNVSCFGWDNLHLLAVFNSFNSQREKYQICSSNRNSQVSQKTDCCWDSKLYFLPRLIPIDSNKMYIEYYSLTRYFFEVCLPENHITWVCHKQMEGKVFFYSY